MRKLALAVAAVAAFSAAPASASVTVNYTITGTGTGGIILTCSDTFSACSLDYLLLYSLPGFPTSFSTANAGLLQSLSGVTIGGTTGGVNGIDLPSNADDFLFTFAPDVASQTVSLTYVSGLAEQIFPSFGELTITQVQSPGTPAVPEPATWAMMLLGFGALGLSQRRKRSRLESAFHPKRTFGPEWRSLGTHR